MSVEGHIGAAGGGGVDVGKGLLGGALGASFGYDFQTLRKGTRLCTVWMTLIV